MRLLRRLKYWLRLRANHDDLADELALHRDLLERDFLARGLSIHDAKTEARRALGNDTLTREDARHIWLSANLEALWQDASYALRGLRRNPGFTAAVVLTLSLGLGVNAAMFSLVDRLFFRPPPLLIDPSTAHRAYLYRTYRGVEAERSGPYLRYTDLRQWTTAFSHLAAFSERSLAVGTGDDARELPVGVVSASFFDFFNAPPIIGRYFTEAEDAPPAGTPLAILSYSTWLTRYAGVPSALDSILEIGKVRYRIIGVAPRPFVGLWPDRPPVVYIPVTTYGRATSGRNWWSSYGHAIGIGTLLRRKPGVTVAVATADLTHALRLSYQAQIAQDPRTEPLALSRPRGVVASVLSERGPEATAVAKVASWLGAVSLAVLLIACANVANLLLARAVRRRREIAVRISLGVSRARLAALTLTETLLLALMSGACGLVIAHWAGGVIRTTLLPTAEPAPIVSDWRTFAFAFVTTIVVGLLAGIAPVLQSRRVDLVDDLKSGVREGTYQRSRARSVLVIAQSALSVALLVGAGLFVQSIRHVRNVRLGYDVDPVLIMRWSMRGEVLDSAHTANLDARLLDAARSVPGVERASLITDVPFEGESELPLFVEGIDSVGVLGSFDRSGVSPEYFATMGTRLLRGRGIASTDDDRSPRVMVVGESMARVLWPGLDPIGKCVRIAGPSAPCTTVVGVAEDIHTHTISREVTSYFYYLPVAQMGPYYMALAIRTQGDAGRALDAVRRRLQHELPGAAYATGERFSDVVGNETRAWRVGAAAFTALGALAVLVAAIGLYSVIAYSVTQRTHEIGVRLALGAPRRGVVCIVLVDGLRLSVGGIAIGCAISLSASRWIAPLLFEEPPRDPLVYALVTIALITVAIAATIAPATRAALVDPKQALMAE